MNLTIAEIFNLLIWGMVFFILIVQFIKSIRLVPTQSSYIVERLGKYHKTLLPGFHALVPFIDKVTYIQNLKEQTIDVPPQSCFSKDEVKVEVDGVLYIRVVEPEKSSSGITNYVFAAIQLAQTTTRSIIGTLELDKTFEEREFISKRVVEVLEQAGETWGIRVLRYEIRNITPNPTVRNAMEKQVTAERERRAILAKSEGDKQAMINLSEGVQREMINVSEGEMTRRINEAQGQAQEILEIAAATAESIEKVALAISEERGVDAITLQLMEKYIRQFKFLADSNVDIILPANLLNFEGLMNSVGLRLPQDVKN